MAMDKNQPDVEKSPEQLHQQQRLLQIFIPALVAILICIAAFVLLIIGTSSNADGIEQWAQISTLFILLPLILFALIFLAILIVLCKILGGWQITLPLTLRKIRNKSLQILQTLDHLGRKPAQPIVRIKGLWAGFQSLFKK